MSYSKIKAKILESGFTDSKGLNKLILHLILFMSLLGISFAFVVGCITTTLLSFCAMLLFALCFLFVLDYATQSKEAFTRVVMLGKFWWVGIPLLVVFYVVMKLFYFI